MKHKLIISSLLLAASVSLSAQKSATITIEADKGTQIIPKEIYGQFAEHLGTCIYGGLWVGEDSPIPNIKGYRTDVFNALKELQIPVLRWPGGCFADEYHWMDGIGPKEQRPKMVNNNWGGTIEDNSFGTHEFLNLCEMLGCEPYISGNVGSGSVDDPYASPLFGNFEELGRITVFIGTREILYPDTVLLHEKLLAEGIEHDYFVWQNQIHTFSVFPMPERAMCLQQVKEILEAK